MRHRPIYLACLLFATTVFAARSSQSVTVVVPDNYATIQAAINSGADIVQVKQGIYVENVTIAHAVQLTSFPAGEFGTIASFPHIQGDLILQSPPSNYQVATISGFRISGAVSLEAVGGPYFIINIAECRLDGGITRTGTVRGSVAVRGCTIVGMADAWADYSDITGNTIIGGTVKVIGAGIGCADVRDNYVIGPAARGIEFAGNTGCAPRDVINNTVTGCTDGIVVLVAGSKTVKDNIVTNCSGIGYKILGNNESVGAFDNNIARQCGSYGMYTSQAAGHLDGNTIEDCVGGGIFIEGTTVPMDAHNNRILRCGGDGLSSAFSNEISGNVVGRSAGRGIALLSSPNINLHNNTSYNNALAGFYLATGPTTTVNHNIGYGNQRQGLSWAGSGTPTLSCNDWYGNALGATLGVPPGATDLAVDPLFCNVIADNVTLSSVSPVLNAAGCGLIGALGLGCTNPTGVSGDPGDRTFSATPLPSRGFVRFSWPRLSSGAKLQLYDAGGSRRWSADLKAGSETLEWKGVDAQGQLLPAGVYFAQLATDRGVAHARVVLIH